MQTPFADRLYTNYTPLDHEIEQMHRVIAGPLEDLSRLDEKIAHLRRCQQAIIDELLWEREVLSRFVDAHHALLSTIRRFSPELLQKIFTHCLDEGVDDFKRHQKAPILLAQVCSSWRRLVMSTPELWSSLCVTVPDLRSLRAYGKDALLQHPKLVERWLELSGHYPLSISFICKPVGNPEVDFAAGLLLQILISFSQRWETLDLSLPLPMFVRFFTTITEADVPLLKSIRLISYELVLDATYSARQAASSSSIFRVSHLRSLSISRGLDISLVAANWNHLAHIDLEVWLTTSKALKVLSSCTNVISCKLSNLEVDDTTSFPTISLPLLRSLDMIANDSDLTEFFGVLEVHGLRSFRYLSDLYTAYLDTPFKSILTQSLSPGIESIELPSVSLSTVAEILPLLPHLKRLCIHDSYPKTRAGLVHEPLYYGAAPIFDDDILARLTPFPDSAECLCPCLQEIEFYGCSNITNDALCVFFTARTSHPAVARLKRAVFAFPSRLLRDFTLEGLELDRLSVKIFCGPEWRRF